MLFWVTHDAMEKVTETSVVTGQRNHKLVHLPKYFSGDAKYVGVLVFCQLDTSSSHLGRGSLT